MICPAAPGNRRRVCFGGPALMTDPFAAVLAAGAALSPAAVAGALGVAANGVWPLLRSRRQILAVQVLASILFGLHYTLLGARTGAAMCVAAASQALAASTLSRGWRRNAVFGVTVAAGLAVSVATWSGLTSALALTALAWATIGRLQRRPQAIRLSFLGSEAFWVSHNVLVGSSWGLTSDAMVVTTLLVGLWRGRERLATGEALPPSSLVIVPAAPNA